MRLRAGPLRGALDSVRYLPPRTPSRLGSPGRGDVVHLLALELGADYVVNQLRKVLTEPIEHALLVFSNRGGERRCLLVTDPMRKVFQRPVGGDLERLGCALVLGVLEQLLLAALSAHEVQWPLAQGNRLAEQALDGADA